MVILLFYYLLRLIQKHVRLKLLFFNSVIKTVLHKQK